MMEKQTAFVCSESAWAEVQRLHNHSALKARKRAEPLAYCGERSKRWRWRSRSARRLQVVGRQRTSACKGHASLVLYTRWWSGRDVWSSHLKHTIWNQAFLDLCLRYTGCVTLWTSFSLFIYKKRIIILLTLWCYCVDSRRQVLSTESVQCMSTTFSFTVVTFQLLFLIHGSRHVNDG